MVNEKNSSEQHSRQPIIESFISLSADNKWILHKTVITDIKPIGYMQKVLGEKPKKA